MKQRYEIIFKSCDLNAYTYKLNRNWDFWARIAAFNYREIDKISAGINEIDGNSRTDFTLQTKYSF